MLSVAEARLRVIERARPLDREMVAIDEADGRVLAAPAVASRRLPPADNSAMDGFAVRSADLPATLPVTGEVAAGDPPERKLAPGTAMRIMTGAPMPAGADTIVIREDADDHGETVTLPAAAPGHNLRRAGEDVEAGSVALEAGSDLGPGEVGLLAALGFARVEVSRRPRVAILSTGNELCSVDAEPGPGRIVDSNGYALAAQVREAGGAAVRLGIVGDDRGALARAMRRGLESDLLVTSGGVSAGDHDHVRDVLGEIGVELAFWKVAVKPGKPLAFGAAPGGALVFGLPGNPVSSMVTFELMVRPALRFMLGARALDRPRAEVVMAHPYRKRPGRAHYLRARLERRGDVLEAHPHARQGSGMLSSMIGVDALVEIDRDADGVDAGARVPALLLRAV